MGTQWALRFPDAAIHTELMCYLNVSTRITVHLKQADRGRQAQSQVSKDVCIMHREISLCYRTVPLGSY